MPELAEVETVRLLIEDHLHGEVIKDVTADAKDKYLFEFESLKAFKKALIGARIVGSGRKGKYFWLELDRRPFPIFHLGMTGNIAISTSQSQPQQARWEGAKLWSEGDLDLKDRLRFGRLQVRTKKGHKMIFLDPRRFGRLWLSENPAQHPRIRALGFDPLLNFPSAKDLHPLLVKRKTTIKGILLDQSLFAGIGNWLADEILFLARISPHTLGAEMTFAQTKKLHQATLKVVKKAVAVRADYERFPKSWLFHHRWGKNKEARISTGEKIVHETVAGRTTAWVPDVVLTAKRNRS